jgi:hypothetical protein
MMRIPFYWEDDYEMEQVAPCWHLKPLHADAGSIMVFNFHPLHVYLNSADLKPYDGVKRLAPRLTDVTEITAEPWIHQGKGTRTVFTETVSHLSCNQRSLNIRDIYLWWESSKQ